MTYLLLRFLVCCWRGNVDDCNEKNKNKNINKITTLATLQVPSGAELALQEARVDKACVVLGTTLEEVLENLSSHAR